MIPAYILAGGHSRRFGSDKARHPMPNQPQLLVLRDQLHSAGHSVYVVADRADRYRDLGIDCLTDIQSDSGPLSGLASALAHHHSLLNDNAQRIDGWLMLVSCDQRHWQHAWYEALADHTSRPVDAICYHPRSAGCQPAQNPRTLWQPLPGLYHIDLLSTVLNRLEQQQLSLHSLLDALADRCQRVLIEQPPSRWSFNTPAELEP